MEPIRLIEVKEEILTDNQALADELRERLRRKRTYLLNLMGSPGCGKTTVILKTIEALKKEFRMGIIEADIESTVDAEKVAALGVSAVQLRTGGFCHVDASMVAKALDALDLDALDLIIIENVGNLVCPAEFDTGAVKRAMLLSVPEGDDKPLKYPLMFAVCHALLLSKIDYLGFSDFDLAAVRQRALNLNPAIQIFDLSAKTGQGMDQWANWLREEVRSYLGQ